MQRAGVSNVVEVERLKREHLSGARKHSKLLFSLLMFQLWSEKYQRTPVVRAVPPSVTFAA